MLHCLITTSWGAEKNHLVIWCWRLVISQNIGQGVISGLSAQSKACTKLVVVSQQLVVFLWRDIATFCFSRNGFLKLKPLCTRHLPRYALFLSNKYFFHRSRNFFGSATARATATMLAATRSIACHLNSNPGKRVEKRSRRNLLNTNTLTHSQQGLRMIFKD